MTIKIKRTPKKVERSMWEMKDGFTMIPNRLLQSNLGIDAVARSVLMTLLSRARWDDRPSVTARTLPTTYATFEATGLYRNSISAAMKKLHEVGFVSSEQKDRRSPRVYTIYLSAIEAAVLRSTRATTQQSTRATTTSRLQSTRATTEQSTRATATKEHNNKQVVSRNVTNQQAVGWSEDNFIDENGSSYFPHGYLYDPSTLLLSPEAKRLHTEAEALAVVAADRFFIRRSPNGVPLRLFNGAWTLVNQFGGKCRMCDTFVAKGTGVFEGGKRPTCVDHGKVPPLVLGVGSWEEYVPLFHTEEELFGDGRFLYDHVSVAGEVFDLSGDQRHTRNPHE